MKVSSATVGSPSCLFCGACERELVMLPVCLFTSHCVVCVCSFSRFLLFFICLLPLYPSTVPPPICRASCQPTTSIVSPFSRLGKDYGSRALTSTHSLPEPLCKSLASCPLIAPLEMTFSAPLSFLFLPPRPPPPPFARFRGTAWNNC